MLYKLKLRYLKHINILIIRTLSEGFTWIQWDNWDIPVIFKSIHFKFIYQKLILIKKVFKILENILNINLLENKIFYNKLYVNIIQLFIKIFLN